MCSEQVPYIKGAIVAANLPSCYCCAALLVYCSIRDWTRICYVIGFENIRIHPFTCYSLRIFFLHSLESGLKNVRIRCRIRRIRVDGSRIQKEKVEYSKISNTCGWGLRKPWTPKTLMECDCVAREKLIRREKLNLKNSNGNKVLVLHFARLS